ncbi:MAG: aminomethyltransferase family protein, partial [Planctomycetota bacterium]
CTSRRWKDWAGWAAVCSFESCHEAEYFAIRQAAGLLDVSPLFKLEIRGRDAAEFLSYVWTRDITKLKAGRVVYGCWCDDDGHVLDDGTITRLSTTRFRMTSAEPAYAWLCERSRGFDVEIEDVTKSVCALALQGPTSRAIVSDVFGESAAKLGFFRGAEERLLGSGPPVYITRTGYTGDLGYELWLAPDHALECWDALIEHGERHRIRPIGLDALDVSRLEAGFLLCGVEYKSAKTARTAIQKSTPYELGLDWCVELDREPFVGQAALRAEAQSGPKWKLVGLVSDWDETEAHFEAAGLPPSLPAGAWRDGRPVYDGAQQIGRATSGTWSPTLKQNIALASVEARYATPGTELRLEETVEYERKTVRATVTERPFFDPPRKKA